MIWNMIMRVLPSPHLPRVTVKDDIKLAQCIEFDILTAISGPLGRDAMHLVNTVNPQ
jgi:hypothetical protein